MTTTPQDEFAARLEASVQDGTFVRLTLGKPQGADPTLRKVIIRPVQLKAGPRLSFVWRHDTRDITKNHPPTEALHEVAGLLGPVFQSAHLATTEREVQLEYRRDGEPRLSLGRASTPTAPPDHDRPKARLLTAASQDWLEALGVTNAQGTVRPGMADKHRQIHHYVELVSHLVAGATLPADRPVEVADMGCGKGYLTFALHDYFDQVARRSARVCGVEARPDLVALCNRIAHDTHRPKLSFLAGTIETAPLPPSDILIALHACDTATDDALARGVAARAALLVVAPCCQKELRPQLTAPPVLAPALRHGLWQERQAEFVTDALRALLLEWAGYDTKAFEFISTEHTAKNVMLAATRRPAPPDPARTAEAAQQARDFAHFYGIRTHTLARHLQFALE